MKKLYVEPEIKIEIILDESKVNYYENWKRRRVRVERKKDGWMDKWMDGWINGWMNAWMDGWMNAWMDGWMDG